MSDKYFVGLDVVSSSNNGKYKPVSRVTLMVDDSKAITAGDDTGYEIVADCPHATQAMVDSLLASFKGHEYQAYSAGDANVDPSAELGDGITVSGIYSVLSRVRDDGSGFPSLEAPGKAEDEDEYPSGGPMTQAFNRELAQARSLISKTAEEIRLEVNGLDGKYTALAVTIDGVTVKDSTGTTKIKGSSIETSTLIVDAANITGTLTIGNLPPGVAMTSDIPSDADITVITNNAIRTASISANQITAGTFTGGSLDLSGLMRLVNDSGTVYGCVGTEVGNASGVETTGVVLRNIYNDAGFIATNGGARVYCGDNAIYCVPTGCFSTSEMRVSSDLRLKNSISYDFTKEEKMFSGLKPCSFSYNRDESGKIRWGFVAQEFLESAEQADMNVDDLDVVVKDDQGMYAIAYGEMVALNTHMIQRLMERVSVLEAKG